MTVDQTLQDRNGTHGDYKEQAAMGEAIREVMMQGKNWGALTTSQRDCLIMVSVKISRILTGDQNHVDSWHDMQGYPRLVEKDLLASAPSPEKVSIR